MSEQNLKMLSSTPINENQRQNGDKPVLECLKSPHPPWKDSHGKDLSLDRLKTISSRWSAIEWEQYLESLEVPLEELLFNDSIHEEKVIEVVSAERLFDTIKEESYVTPAVENAIRRILRFHLSKRENEVIWLRYWDGKTIEEIREALAISRRSVRVILDRAHFKIKSQLFLNSLKKSKYLSQLDITGS